ncbi:GPI transamidase component PIG-S-like [Anneissia japonica]|uniref:GPI transamidase component PIG-S-like n=1 Tax=Anneissia japonica TaxID=1529436 RepID=UPI0014256684|nr:GPI transamidase component PIG-S-like [Anneissia japonica]
MERKKKADIADQFQKNDEANKTYAALAVALVCAVIGLPMWWLTTTTYRANLPYSQIEQLAKSKISVVVPTDVWLCLDQKQSRDTQLYRKLEQKLSLGIVRLGDLSIQYKISLNECSGKTAHILSKSKTLKDFDMALTSNQNEEEMAQPKLGKSDVYILSEQLFNSSSTILSQKRRGYVKFEQDLDNTVAFVMQLIREVFTNERLIVKSHLTSKQSANSQDDIDSMRALRSKPGYELSFNLLNPDPASIHYTWDIASGVQSYLQPFLDKLSEFADFGVESQVLYYSKLAVQPRKSGIDNSYILPYEHLAHVINPIEARLGSHISTNPDLNFIVYLPTKSQSPLYVMDAHDNRSLFNAFLSPRWGGVLVYNTPENVEDKSERDPLKVDMQYVMEVFVGQLRLLLGIPAQNADMFLQEEKNSAITDWEVDVLFRTKTLENIATASSTLTSLSQLLGKISNMVIKDNVAKEVYSAVETIQLSERFLAEGNVYRAFHASKKAIQTAEEAFFDSSLLELLYFPEDQKFAIYIPLFLPIMLPIVSSFYKSVRWLRSRNNDSSKEKHD